MAREASDVLLSIREVPVDLARHDDHLAGHFLLRLFIAGEVSLHMTGFAFRAQRDTKRPHRVHQPIGLQQLKIFRLGRRTFLFAFRLLGEQSSGDQ